MFGLMRSRCGNLTDDQKLRRRLHYCGACKTLGGLYGQKTRMLLNFDAVFLGELLTALVEPVEKFKDWDQSYQSYNCLNLPNDPDAMPLSLQVAATATLVLAEFKVVDQITDSRKAKWRIAQRLFSTAFRKATARLKEWDFPVEELRASLRDQETREARALPVHPVHSVHNQPEQESREAPLREASNDPHDIISYLADPTATATGLFFGEGARIVGRPDCREEMELIGRAFGNLIYLLDALEDFEKDARSGSFNAIRSAFGVDRPNLPSDIRRVVLAQLRRLADDIERRLRKLEIDPVLGQLFTGRLKTNLSAKTGMQLHILGSPAQSCSVERRTFSTRWREAFRVGQVVRNAHTVTRPSAVGRLQAPFVFASALFIAILFPAQARTATNYRECVDIGFNLMALGALAGTIVTAPVRWLPVARSNVTPGPTHTRSVRRRVVRQGGPQFVCCCCPGDCCQACCLAEMCAECSCEACFCADCMGGCCESGCCECCAAG